MKRLFFVLALLMTTIMGYADSYDQLWKEVERAAESDLPKTQIEVLDKIAGKAAREKVYGQLLAAELLRVSVQTQISPDSLQPAVDGLIGKARSAESKDPVLAAVYYTSLCRLVANGYTLDAEYREQAKDYRAKALARPELLAGVKAAAYLPLITKGDDSRIFGDDLLHVIGMELDDFQTLHDYYDRAGNRSAACLCALSLYDRGDRQNETAPLDSLLSLYGDLPEGGAVAVRKYSVLSGQEGVTPGQLVAYIDDAVNRWPSWSGMNQLRNNRKELINPTFSAVLGSDVLLPGRERVVKLQHVRHLSSVTMSVSRVNLAGDTDLRPTLAKDLAKIRKAITQRDVQLVTRHYSGKADYELTDDSLTIQPLPVGVYLVEFTAEGQKEQPTPVLLYVSNLQLLSEELPEQKIRFAVVDATTGAPVPHAKIQLSTSRYYGKPDLVETVATGNNGETIFTYKTRAPYRAYITTDTDKACPVSSVRSYFSYYENKGVRNTVRVFTDRRLYRPGQVVHASAVLYEVNSGLDARVVAGNMLTFALRDANYKEVSVQEVKTDEFGVASADFDLPQGGLTGGFAVIVRGMMTSGTANIHVEEYKRPTFQIEIPEYKEKYQHGDTVVVKGFAKTYSGVPVQGAKVSYRVTRRQALWWWFYRNDEGDEQLLEDETTTADDGSFEMRLPMLLPKDPAATGSWRPRFYQFEAAAIVTDQGGESHDASISLPLGTRTTAFGCNLPEKAVADSLRTLTFTYKNAAGQDIPGQVFYAFDGGQEQTGEAGKPLPVSLKSGLHHLVARCGSDTIRQDVIVFSMHDKRPVVETHDWFYASDSRFPRDGGPVYVQVGSSDPDQYIFYSVLSGENVLESGVIRQSNALTTRRWTYQEKYGSGVTLTFAWVKEGVVYTHRTSIGRPLPDKHLTMTWKTFRDRLTPGQQEEWTLTVKRPDGKPAPAHVMATLYDQSLDQILRHQWSLSVSLNQYLPNTSWNSLAFNDASTFFAARYSTLSVGSLEYRHFDGRYFPELYFGYGRSGFRGNMRLMKSSRAVDDMVVVEEAPMMMAAASYKMESADMATEEKAEANGLDSAADSDAGSADGQKDDAVQLRENLAETAFFLPSLVADANGDVNIRFTLPESVTTWRFMGVSHDKEMNCGYLEGLSVAQKTVMIQPNVPRFIREGDQATLAARLFNTSEGSVSGKARLELVDPETDQVVYTDEHSYQIAANGTTAVLFKLSTDKMKTTALPPLLIARTLAVGDGYSDGEQHYLPVLPAREMVLNTYPFTQHEPGVKEIELTRLFPENTTRQRLTVEYTNNPAWLMIQTLPYTGDADDENAISLAAAFYANSLSHEILNRSPRIRQTIQQWRMEKPTVANGGETSMMSSLQKDGSLKELLLNETPWVMDAEHEADQKQQLVRFFDENALKDNLAKTARKLKALQNPDGSWSWWPGMHGSLYMTVAVSEMIVRLESMLGGKTELSDLLPRAYRYMEQEIHDEVLEMKRVEKRTKGELRPSESAVSYLYVSSFHNDRKNSYPEDVDYLIDRLNKQKTALTIYGKARTAVVLARHGKKDKAAVYLQSIKEHTVFKEEMGRYFDTFKAAYSWFDYRIPSQVAAIEALSALTPDDRQTIEEMQRWLLQSKRTQAWDTPINSVNAVYAFLANGHRTPWEQLGEGARPTVLRVNGDTLETPQATAGIGYVKVVRTNDAARPSSASFRTFSADKTSEGTSWGAVYAQFMQPVTDIAASSSGLTVKRELVSTKTGKPVSSSPLAVGDKVTVRITVTADRDYDFVQVVDKRAACLEPVGQLSGYHWGYYCSPKDCTTNYYFDRLAKGKHVVETEYFIDRAGDYNTGTCTAQCAYAPEYTGRDKGMKVSVRE